MRPPLFAILAITAISGQLAAQSPADRDTLRDTIQEVVRTQRAQGEIVRAHGEILRLHRSTMNELVETQKTVHEIMLKMESNKESASLQQDSRYQQRTMVQRL